MTYDVTRHAECPKCDVELTFVVAVNPGYEPRICFDHDSPHYSDPGDPGDAEIADGPRTCPECGLRFDEAFLSRIESDARQETPPTDHYDHEPDEGRWY